ncbi:DUF4238 domain-containing protein [Embleya sp. NPDC050154]|uniref:DUF4238 domain-containing protein n=1 Tax=unclassified Embleya TaxID=2699296 RepID=UPI0037A81287
MRKIDEWDPTVGVGARHHTVPRFLIEPFADTRGRVWVRDRRTGRPGLRMPADLAVKDFYTFIHVDGYPDGRMEQLLASVEASGAAALRFLAAPGRASSPTARRAAEADLGTLVGFPVVRGQYDRLRRVARPRPVSNVRGGTYPRRVSSMGTCS